MCPSIGTAGLSIFSGGRSAIFRGRKPAMIGWQSTAPEEETGGVEPSETQKPAVCGLVVETFRGVVLRIYGRVL